MRLAFLLVLVAAALSAALYAPVFDGEFQFDDQSSIVENSAVHSHDPARIYRFWPGRYLVYQSFALQHARSGLDPRPFHLVNALIHGLAAAFCGLWVYALMGPGVPDRRRYIATLVAAGFFLAHPLQSQAVSYVVQRAASMAACFSLAALAAHAFALRAETGSRARRTLLITAWAASLCAMFCKEFAIVLPLAIVLVELSLGSAAGRRLRIPLFLLLLPVVPLVAASADAFGAAGSEGLLAETVKVSRIDYARTQCEAFVRYVKLIVWPSGQNVDHHLPWHGPNDWFRTLLFAMAPLAALLAAALLYRRGSRLQGLAVALFLLFLMPESSIFPIQDAMFEHRLYLPMAAIALLLALSLRWERRAVWLAISIYLIGLGALTVRRHTVWMTPMNLWSDAVRKSPQKGRPHVALGVELAQLQRFDEAQRELEIGLRLQPDSARGWTNLGNLRLLGGDMSAARAAYERALSIRPSHTNAWYNLGVLSDREGALERAGECYQRALQASPDHTGALNALAAVRIRQGRIAEARTLAERAAALGAPATAILERLR